MKKAVIVISAMDLPETTKSTEQKAEHQENVSCL